MPWISATAVLTRLKVRPQTLYAYVSRGQIAAKPDPADPRRSLYSQEDIERLTARKARGRRAAAVAEATMSFGEPVLASAITTLQGGRLYYRGQDAVALSDADSFEEVCRLLWGCGPNEDPFPRQPAPAEGAARPAAVASDGPDARARMFALLAWSAARDPATAGRSPVLLRTDAAKVLSRLADAASGAAGTQPIHTRLASAWGVEDPRRADLIRRILALCADHELHTSAFAARVVASTGANLAACALAGLSALSGPLHGGAAVQVAAFLDEAQRSGDPRGAALKLLAQGLEAPGFGHLLYPEGDPRARAIAGALPWREDIAEAARACEAVTGQPPNIDFALVAAARTLELPSDAPFVLFAVAKAAGWLAHALEQRLTGQVIRPRARYVGIEVE